MLYWAVVFLVIALVAALFGFGGIASAAAGIAKLLFFIFVVVFVILFVLGLFGRRTVYPSHHPRSEHRGDLRCLILASLRHALRCSIAVAISRHCGRVRGRCPLSCEWRVLGVVC
jgi:uncharacterized membrane protein YtjA (UPF0391 family)